MSDLTYTTTLTLATPPARVWQALTDPAQAAQYHLAPLRQLDLHEGGKISYGTDAVEMITGEITRLIPAQQLDHTFRFAPSQQGTKDDPETLVSYRLEEINGGTKLILTHSGFPYENQTYTNISGGWPFILDALKTFVEKKP